MSLGTLVLFVMISVGSIIGWYCGSFGGIMGSYFVSVAGSAIGLYLGRKIQKNLNSD